MGYARYVMVLAVSRRESILRSMPVPWLVTIGILIPLHVTTAAVRECMGDHLVRFLFAPMGLPASMNIKVWSEVVAILYIHAFTATIVMILILVTDVTLALTTKSAYN